MAWLSAWILWFAAAFSTARSFDACRSYPYLKRKSSLNSFQAHFLDDRCAIKKEDLDHRLRAENAGVGQKGIAALDTVLQYVHNLVQM